MTKASVFLKLLKTNCDFLVSPSAVTRLRFSCIRAEAFRTWKIGSGKSWQRKSPNIAKITWNVLKHHSVSFNCLSWSILTQRDEKYEYSVIDSRWCVRVFFSSVYDIYMPFYFYIYGK